jgi:hypothetical protein
MGQLNPFVLQQALQFPEAFRFGGSLLVQPFQIMPHLLHQLLLIPLEEQGLSDILRGRPANSKQSSRLFLGTLEVGQYPQPPIELTHPRDLLLQIAYLLGKKVNLGPLKLSLLVQSVEFGDLLPHDDIVKGKISEGDKEDGNEEKD